MSVSAKYTKEILEAKRQKGDPAADAFISDCFSNIEKRDSLYFWLRSPVQTVPEVFSTEPLFTYAMQLPSWSNEKVLERAARFLKRHENEVMHLLGLFSLPYCYCAADGAMVLYLTERLKNDAAKRLQETGDFVQTVQSPGAFLKEGKGFAGVLKTRLIHAIARHHLQNSGKWQNTLGVPVNQEDLAGTQIAFSLIIIRGLRQLGFTVSDQDQQAVIHLWSTIACLLGQDPEFIPQNGKEANYLDKLLRERLFRPSEQGRVLANSLIDSIVRSQPDNKLSRKDVQQFMLFFLGEDLDRVLGITNLGVPAHVPVLLKAYSILPRLKRAVLG